MKRKLTLIVILAIFLVPLLLAWQLYQQANNHDRDSSQTMNHGELIEPVIPAKDLGLKGKWLQANKWTLLYLDKQCDDSCQQQLNVLQRIHKATGKNQDRVQRVLIVDPKLTENGETELFEEGSIYLVDPYGNMMMHYSNKADPNGILKDLGRLLMIKRGSS